MWFFNDLPTLIALPVTLDTLLKGLPILIASLALALTGYQFITRHRPFVGVTDGKLRNEVWGFGVVIKFKNWGEIPASNVHYTITAQLSSSTAPEALEINKSLGVVLPQQEMQTIWWLSLDDDTRTTFEKMYRIPQLKVTVTVKYRGSMLFYKRTSQTFLLDKWGCTAIGPDQEEPPKPDTSTPTTD